MKKPVSILFILGFIIVGIAGFYFWYSTKPAQKSPEGKIVSSNYSEELSTEFISTVPVGSRNWQPQVRVESGSFSCVEGEFFMGAREGLLGEGVFREAVSMLFPTAWAKGLPKERVMRTIHDRIYCVETSSEGAAGTRATSYAYITAQGNQLITVNFTMFYSNCDAYDEPGKQACELEQKTFDLDGMVDRTVASLGL